MTSLRENLTRSFVERFVDTIAFARNLAEEKA